MADLTKVQIGDQTYSLADQQARELIETLQNSLTGAMTFIGEALQFNASGPVYIKTGSTTAVCYYTGTQPTATTIVIGGTTYTLTYKKLSPGDVVISGQLEFIWSDADNTFHELGSTGSLKALAFKDNASGNYKPKGTVKSTPTKTNKTLTPVVTQGTVNATGNYTPEGTITQGTNQTDSFVKSYPGATSKLLTTTVHDTPTTKKANVTTKDIVAIKSLSYSKLTTTTIQGVSGSTQASKASSNIFAGVNASVNGETLILTPVSLSFTDVAVPVAQTSKTVATGSLSTNGTGAQLVTSGTQETNNVVEAILDENLAAVPEIVMDIEAGTEKTVATGTLSAQGTGASVMTGLGTPNKATAVTNVATPTFTGKEKEIAVSGSTNGVAVASMTIQTIDTITSTFEGTEETITVD